jgi:hypothetical protein
VIPFRCYLHSNIDIFILPIEWWKLCTKFPMIQTGFKTKCSGARGWTDIGHWQWQ